MNGADVFLLLTVVGFGLRGFSRGCIRELLGTVGFVGGVVAAVCFTPAVSRFVEANVAVSGVVAGGATFTLIYSVISSAAGFTGLLFRGPAAGLRKVFRGVGGAVVGAIKAMVVVGFLFFFAAVFRVSSKLDTAVAGSLLVRPIVAASQAALRTGHIVSGGSESAQQPPRA